MGGFNLALLRQDWMARPPWKDSFPVSFFLLFFILHHHIHKNKVNVVSTGIAHRVPTYYHGIPLNSPTIAPVTP